MPTPTPPDYADMIVKVITALGALVAAVASLVAAFKSNKAVKQSEDNAQSLTDLHTTMNMRLK